MAEPCPGAEDMAARPRRDDEPYFTTRSLRTDFTPETPAAT